MLVEIRNDFVPTLLAGFRIERHQVIVRSFEIEPILVHPHSAIADVRAALGLPEVVPEDGAIAGIHGPGIVGYGKIRIPFTCRTPPEMCPAPRTGTGFIDFPADDRGRVSRTGPGKWSSGAQSRGQVATQASPRFFMLVWLIWVSVLKRWPE